MLVVLAVITGSPAFWGLCGGSLYGALGLVAAYSARVGNPVARRRALLEMAVAVVFAPVVAEALTGMVLRFMPSLPMQPVSMTIGLLTVPYAPQYVAHLKRKIDERLGGRS